jgi:hypothetical protein
MIRSDDRIPGDRSASDGATRTGQSEQDNRNRATGKGQPELDNPNTPVLGRRQVRQDYWDRTSKKGRSGLVAPIDHHGQHDNKSRKD